MLLTPLSRLLLKALGRFKEAQSGFEQAVATSQAEDSSILVARAHFWRSSDPEYALSDTVKAIAANGKDPVAHLTQGKIYEQVGSASACDAVWRVGGPEHALQR